MNTELFIARKLFFDKKNKQLLSQKIIRIALYGIALSFSVMLVSVAVVTGFKNEVRNKIIGFGSHIQIVNLDSRNSYELAPISKNQTFLPYLKQIKDIRNIHIYATKAGIIKTEDYIHGIVFKGVHTDFNWDFFEKNLLEGTLPVINDSVRVREIILSEQVCKLLKLKLNDNALFYFINGNDQTPLMLQLKICGIYKTGLEEFDQLFVIGDIKQIRRLNKWQDDEVSGFEIEIKDFKKINYIEQEVRDHVISYKEDNETILRTESIVRVHPQIFDWLSILDLNVWVILALMILVSGFNMISGLLVLILEITTMIGVLKALGSPDWNIRKVFLYLSAFLTSRGILWGNFIGLTIVLLQKYFNVIKLDPTAYYVDFVPMHISISTIVILNLASIALTTAMLIVPSFLISKITPEKSIRFD